MVVEVDVVKYMRCGAASRCVELGMVGVVIQSALIFLDWCDIVVMILSVSTRIDNRVVPKRGSVMRTIKCS